MRKFLSVDLRRALTMDDVDLRKAALGASSAGGARRDWLLIGLTLVAGCVDGLSYLGLGRVFTANMTGNSVLLGLAIGQTQSIQVVHSAVALGGFALGVLLGARLVGPGPERIVWSPRVTLALGVELVLLAGFALGWWAAGADPAGLQLDALIAVSAAAMGVQSAAARRLAVSGVATTYVTGTLTGLMAEVAAFGGSSGGWRRPAGVLIALVAGAVIGGLAGTHLRPGAGLVPPALLAIVVLAAAVGFPRPPAAVNPPARRA
jgi:uncharacterized membrane protein YoaK (UPF0700 family)